jgi:cysteinyl-tRNA synthetase
MGKKIMQSENIRFFNTLTREKERFVPTEKGQVKMYTCGPTVYDFVHIGNLRAFLFEDLLRRWLEYRGYTVTQIMNLTDVDDRTIKASRTQGVPLNQHTARFVRGFFEDIEVLNIEKATHYPRATEHIPEMVALVEKLLDKGCAYRGEDGSIYFDISKFKDYGRLAKIKVEELKAGARVKMDDYAKEEASDFVLWKAWNENDGDVFWETELGKGRPGWHIECSAMSMKYLGETLDIHCGGVDNLFPHHENERAQSESATGKKFVNYWLHNEHLLVEGQKMAKRLGNYYILRDVVAKGHDPMAIRYLMISTHYRQQINFTFDGLGAAQKALERLRNFALRSFEVDGRPAGPKLSELIAGVQKLFGEAMDDDLNISVALAYLFDFVRDVNNLLNDGMVSKEEGREIHDLMMRFDGVLGVVGEVKTDRKLSQAAEDLVRKREEARKAQDWKTADQIREQLKSMGVLIEDTSEGIRWKLEKK